MKPPFDDFFLLKKGALKWLEKTMLPCGFGDGFGHADEDDDSDRGAWSARLLRFSSSISFLLFFHFLVSGRKGILGKGSTKKRFEGMLGSESEWNGNEGRRGEVEDQLGPFDGVRLEVGYGSGNLGGWDLGFGLK